MTDTVRAAEQIRRELDAGEFYGAANGAIKTLLAALAASEQRADEAEKERDWEREVVAVDLRERLEGAEAALAEARRAAEDSSQALTRSTDAAVFHERLLRERAEAAPAAARRALERGAALGETDAIRAWCRLTLASLPGEPHE